MKGLLGASAINAASRAGLLENWNSCKYEYNLKSHMIHADTLCGCKCSFIIMAESVMYNKHCALIIRNMKIIKIMFKNPAPSLWKTHGVSIARNTVGKI